MGTHIHIEVEIPMPRDEYWQILYTREFDEFQAPFVSMKGAIEQHYEVDSQNSNIVRRRVKMLPQITLPSALLWYLGQEEFHYIDEQVKDHAAGVIKTHTIPPVMKDRVKVTGTVRVEPRCDKTCLHVADFNIEISAFGIGGLFEGVMAESVESSHVLIRKAVEAWKEYRRTGVRPQVGPEIAKQLIAEMSPEERSKIVFVVNGVRKTALGTPTTPPSPQKQQQQQEGGESGGEQQQQQQGNGIAGSVSSYLGSWWS